MNGIMKEMECEGIPSFAFRKDKNLKKVKFGQEMTEGSIAKILIRFAIPLLLGNLLQQLYNSVDMMIVGRIVGDVGTVGVSNGGEIAALATFVGIAFSSASQVYTAQLIGSEKKEDIRFVSGTALSFLLLLGTVFAIICLLFCKPLLTLLNCPAEAFEQAYQYMFVVSLGLPFVFGYNAVCGIMRGMGESKRPLVFVAIASAVNVVLDILLVRMIPLQTMGSAIATVASQFIAFAAAIIYVVRHRESIYFCNRKKHLRIRMQYMKPLLRIGLPLTVQSAFIHFSQLICIHWVNGFGMLAAAANSIGAKLNRLINVMTSSVTGAAGAMVAQNIGARNHIRVKKTIYTSMLICLLICVVEYIVAILMPRTLFSLFTKDPEIVEMGVVYLRISLITFALSAVQGPLTAVVVGCGNAKLSFCYGILDGFVLRLGVSYFLAHLCGMGVVGYWYGNALAHLGPVVVAAVYFYSGRWKLYRLM